MKLYHGTSSAVALRALTEGLKTRRSSGLKSLWPAAPSHGNAVYLTNAYAIYFAMHTLNDPQDGDTIGIVEVDTAMLTQLVPDEDVLEQAGRGRDAVRGNMLERTAHYRKNLKKYLGNGSWELGIKCMGTCAHLGDIPASAVSRVSIIDPQQQVDLCWAGMDPSISIQNYAYCAAKYHALTAQAFIEAPGITVLPKTQL